jgi:thymidine phosphorylase
MSDTARAVQLARTMVALGRDEGVRTRALVTAMDVPLGVAVGNALEVAESVEVLAGGGPDDVVELTLLLARHMLELVGIDADPAEAIASGRAMDHWRRMILAQGGDPDAPLPRAPIVETVTADRDGVVTRCDALAIGRAAWRLGAGRATKDDPVSASAGIEVLVKPGDSVVSGAPLLRLHAEDAERLEAALPLLADPEPAVVVSPAGAAYSRLPLVLDIID